MCLSIWRCCVVDVAAFLIVCQHACLSQLSHSKVAHGTCNSDLSESCGWKRCAVPQNLLTIRPWFTHFNTGLPVGGGQKRYAALEVANTLFRVTFRLKNLRLADSIMKGVSHNLSPESVTPFNNFPMSQQVTYKFFEGRIAIFNELYVSCCLYELTDSS